MAHRAYGKAHQQRRRQLLAALKDHHTRTGEWWPCPRCGNSLIPDLNRPGEGIDLGHTDPADKIAGRPGDRLEHAHGNRSAGNETRPSTSWSSVQW